MKKASLVPTVALIGALFMALPSRSPGVKVTLRNYRFSPTQLSIGAGGAVSFTNASKTTHTVTCLGCSIDAGDVQPGQTKTLTFHKSQAIILYCRYHREAGMGMRLRVGNPPTPSPTAPAP